MKKIAVFFANGTEEIEALTVVDLLRRASVETDIVSISGEYPVGSHNIIVKADKTITCINANDYAGIVIPGGLKGSSNLSQNKRVIEIAKEYLNTNKLVASICASPAVVLGSNGLIDGKNVTCYPSENFINLLKNSTYTGKDVEVDGNLITANGIKSAMAFSFKICEYLGVTPKM